MVLLPLTRSWLATWLAVTRQGGFDEFGSLESIFIVFLVFFYYCESCLSM